MVELEDLVVAQRSIEEAKVVDAHAIGGAAAVVSQQNVTCLGG